LTASPGSSLRSSPSFVFDVDWPYDDALIAMHEARDRVIGGGNGTVFVGSHREEVVTLGRRAPESQLVMRAALEQRGVLVRRIERGGGATAHGPGQLVVYPVVRIDSVADFTRALLDGAVDFAAEHGVDAHAKMEPAGVYVDDAKLASIGMRVEHGVVTHGLAINCTNDLSLFQLIAPCGICNQPMAAVGSATSLIEMAHRLAFHVARRAMLAWT
jgi:lipoate-protein ligase B